MADDIAKLGFEVDTDALLEASQAAFMAAANIGKVGDAVDNVGKKSAGAKPPIEATNRSLKELGALGQSLAAGVQGLQGRIAGLATAFGIATGSPGGIALNAVLQTANAGLTGLIQTFGRLGPALGGIAGGVGAIGTAYVGLNAALAVAQDRWAMQQARMEQALKSTYAARTAMDQLFRIAQESGISFDSASDAFIRMARNADTLGASTAQMVQLTETIQKLGIVSGASQGEVASGMLQLSQALASGRLNGDELRSVMENMPALARAIADGLGVSVGQLRAMGAAGELTGQKVFQALLSQGDKVKAQFDQMPGTTERAFTKLTDQVKRFAAEVGSTLNSSQFAQWALNRAAAGVEGLRNINRDTAGGIAGAVAAGINPALRLGVMAATASGAQSGRGQISTLRQIEAGIYEDQRRQEFTGPLAQASSVAQNLDDFAKKAKENETAAASIINGIIAVRNEMSRTGGSPELQKTLDMLNRALIVNRQAFLDDVDAMTKFRYSVIDMQAAIKLGGGGGGMDIVKTAQGLVAAAGRQGQIVDLNQAMAQVAGEKALIAGQDASGIERQVTSQRRLIDVVGQTAASVREVEIATEVADFRFKHFGTVTTPAVEQAIARYATALRNLKVVTDEYALAQAKQAANDNLYVLGVQRGAVGAGGYEQRYRLAAARAAIEERTMPGIYGTRMQEFDAGEDLAAAQQRQGMAEQIALTRRLTGASGNAPLTNQIMLDERIRQATLNLPQADRPGIASQITAQDEADRAKAMRDQTTSLRQNQALLTQQAQLYGLSGQRLAVETALLQHKRDLLKQGVDLTSEEAQTQLQIVESIAAQQFNMAQKQRMQAQIEQALTQGVVDGLMRGFERGGNMAETFVETLKNSFATAVLTPIIQPIMSPMSSTVSNWMSGLMSGGGKGGGGTGGGAGMSGMAMDSGMDFGGPGVGFGAAGAAAGAAGAASWIPYVGWAIAAASIAAKAKQDEQYRASLDFLGPYGEKAFGRDRNAQLNPFGAYLRGQMGGKEALVRGAGGLFLVPFKGDTRRSGFFGGGLGQAALGDNRWFSGDVAEGAIAMAAQINVGEQRLLQRLTPEQIARVNATGLGGREYDFGMERTSWEESEAFANIQAERLTAISAALGKSIEDLTAIMSMSAEEFDKAVADLEMQRGSARWNLRQFAEGGLPGRLGITGLEAFQGSLAVSPTLSPLDRLSGARGQYQSVLERALSGDLDAVREFPGVAQQLIGIGRDVYASGGDFQSIFSEVNSTLAEVLERQRNLQADITRDIPTTILEASNNEVEELKRQTKALVEALGRIETEIGRLRFDAA